MYDMSSGSLPSSIKHRTIRQQHLSPPQVQISPFAGSRPTLHDTPKDYLSVKHAREVATIEWIQALTFDLEDNETGTPNVPDKLLANGVVYHRSEFNGNGQEQA
jgi:hypothetical protein